MKPSSLLVSSIAKRLQDKVAVITGGSSGIGECTARLFIKHGAKVVIADIQDELGHSICEGIGSDELISYVHCDVTNESDIQNAVNTAISKYGKLDIMFSNAGVSGSASSNSMFSNVGVPGSASSPSIFAVDDKNLKSVFNVNVFGAMYAAKHAAKVMVPSKKGSILFTSSVAAVTSGEVSHPYAASKHAVVGLTKNLCVELGKYGIRVNCISPFGVVTPMLMGALGGLSKEKAEEVVCEAANLKEVVLEANDVAEAALYLASDESRYVSGLNLVVDGGYSTTNVSLGHTIKKFFS